MLLNFITLFSFLFLLSPTCHAMDEASRPDFYAYPKRPTLVIGCWSMTEAEYLQKWSGIHSIQQTDYDPDTHSHSGCTTICEGHPVTKYNFKWGSLDSYNSMYDVSNRPKFTSRTILYECLGKDPTCALIGVQDVVRSFNGYTGTFIIEAFHPKWFQRGQNPKYIRGEIAGERRLNHSPNREEEARKSDWDMTHIKNSPMTPEDEQAIINAAPQIERIELLEGDSDSMRDFILREVDPVYLFTLSLYGFQDFEIRRTNPITGRKGLYSLCCRHNPNSFTDSKSKTFDLLKFMDPRYEIRDISHDKKTTPALYLGEEHILTRGELADHPYVLGYAAYLSASLNLND